MSLTETGDRSKMVALYDGSSLVDSFELVAGNFMATSLAVIAAEDENDFVGELDPATLPPLPEQGTWLEKDAIYSYGDAAVMVRQSHYRTEHDPADVPALFVVYREDAPGLDWIVGEPVSVGAIRVYNDITYRCLQAHVTQADWTPPAVPALWAVYTESSGTDEWAAGVAYTIGDIVTYGGSEYECRQSHTSQVGWEPPNVLALWLPL